MKRGDVVIYIFIRWLGQRFHADFDMDSLDVDTIESIDVLKGQKALQKVGAKGKNGVILIRLKK